VVDGWNSHGVGWLMMSTPPSRTSGLPRYMLKKYPSPRHITRIGFMIEFTL
jgi:hypothetical protein